MRAGWEAEPEPPRIRPAVVDELAVKHEQLGALRVGLDAEVGTDAMHALESEALLGAISSPAPAVILAAASTIDDDACVAALEDPSLLVAWLRISPEEAAARFASRGHRPSFGDNPATFLAEQASRRDPRFRSVAGLELDAAGRPEALADRIVEAARGD